MKLQNDPNRIWQEPIVRDLVKQVISRVGTAGWHYLSIQMRCALLAEKALHVAAGLERGEVPCASIACLRRDMERLAGVLEDE